MGLIITDMLERAFALPNGSRPNYDELESRFFQRVKSPILFTQYK